MSQTLHSWTFREYVNPDRKGSWYLWAGLIFAILLLYAVLTANFLFGLIIIMATVIMFVYHHKQETEVKISIQTGGILIDDKLYDFKDFKNFWLVYEPPLIKKLYFAPKSSLKPTLVIPLQNENPVKVRQIIKEHLDEDLAKEGESTLEALERILKL